MADLSAMSDDELRRLYGQPKALNELSDDELRSLHEQSLGPESTQQAAEAAARRQKTAVMPEGGRNLGPDNPFTRMTGMSPQAAGLSMATVAAPLAEAAAPAAIGVAGRSLGPAAQFGWQKLKKDIPWIAKLLAGEEIVRHITGRAE